MNPSTNYYVILSVYPLISWQRRNNKFVLTMTLTTCSLLSAPCCKLIKLKVFILRTISRRKFVVQFNYKTINLVCHYKCRMLRFASTPNFPQITVNPKVNGLIMILEIGIMTSWFNILAFISIFKIL